MGCNYLSLPLIPDSSITLLILQLNTRVPRTYVAPPPPHIGGGRWGSKTIHWNESTRGAEINFYHNSYYQSSNIVYLYFKRLSQNTSACAVTHQQIKFDIPFWILFIPFPENFCSQFHSSCTQAINNWKHAFVLLTIIWWRRVVP